VQDDACPAEPLGRKNLADEFNIIAMLNLAKWWKLAATFAVSVPGETEQQISDGSQTWCQTGLWSG
jgi:hypothetical protein